MNSTGTFCVVVWLAQFVGSLTVFSTDVTESARSIPVSQEVDVVVIGGSSGGVAAAATAAKSGAKVFLAAPRTYLGEDLCATYRLWLEPGENPECDLGRALFSPPKNAAISIPASVPFTYMASLPSAKLHKDTQPGTLLGDGKWASASTQSVQYDGDVELAVDLGKITPLARVGILAYQRPADFVVENVSVKVSSDNIQWTEVGSNTNRIDGKFEEQPVPLLVPASCSGRYLKIAIRKNSESSRVLIAEIIAASTTVADAEAKSDEATRITTPMQVKKSLDDALLQSGVPFLYASYPTEVIWNADNKPAGVVIVNRSGRQAILAKVIVDATESGVVARMGKVPFKEIASTSGGLRFVVVGGKPRISDRVKLISREKPLTIMDQKGKAYPIHEYLLDISRKDGDFASHAAALQLARDLTWTAEMVDISEIPFGLPSQVIRSKQEYSGAWTGAKELPLTVFQTVSYDNLWVLGAAAEVSREAAGQLVRPLNYITLGKRVGQAAADMAKALPSPSVARVAGPPAPNALKGTVGEVPPIGSPRFKGARQIPCEERSLPILGSYDVIVVGGGTGGAPAGIGAARQGAKTLLLEYLHQLGGVGTVGLISQYYYGNRVGFTKEVDDGLVLFGDASLKSSAGWNPEWKIEWYRRQLRKAGADIWFGVLGIGSWSQDGKVKGVVVATPEGRGVILAHAVVDSTGNADIAAAAGAKCRYTDEVEVAVQGTGLPPRVLGARYTNTDYTFVDDTDIMDIWRVFVTARQKYANAYDLGQHVDTRERRQVLGEFFMTPMDMVIERRYPDTIVISKSNFDTHGYTIHPLFLIRPPDREQMAVHVPYRCLLPQGLEGVLVTGLGVSAHRDALPVIRMQADIQNQGYAAGVAASMASKKSSPLRSVDIKSLQKHLIQIGNLPESVLSDRDTFPLPESRIREAVENVKNNYKELEYVLVEPDKALPMLREAYRSNPHNLVYAHVLGMLGDPSGMETLKQAVDNTKWDTGWRYTGMGQFGASMSPLDSYIIALGRTGQKAALEPILKRAAELTPQSEFSHFRAVSIALETLRDSRSANVLAELLQKPGTSGHATTTIQKALSNNPASSTDVTTRNQQLTELYLARALFRCGDQNGLGEKILNEYAQDLHGHYARHAQAVLSQKTAKPQIIP